MIDIHNHYLPDIDDGAATLEESMLLARQAVDQGIHRVVCTPHYHPGRYDWQLPQLQQSLSGLEVGIQREGLPLQLAYAVEVRFSDEILIDLKRGKIPFLGQWQGSEALLLELPHNQVPVGVEGLLKWLLKEGIQPIIAHPERNKAIMRDIRRVEVLIKAGALLQVTAGALLGDFGEPACDIAQTAANA